MTIITPALIDMQEVPQGFKLLRATVARQLEAMPKWQELTAEGTVLVKSAALGPNYEVRRYFCTSPFAQAVESWETIYHESLSFPEYIDMMW
jgi:hypothetical protein